MRQTSFYGLAAAFVAFSASIGAAGAASTNANVGSTESDTGYYTYHYDNRRTGWNPTERRLSTAAVRSSRFGFLRTLAADGVVYAQPLYVPHLQTVRGVRNVVIIATENDSVFAYDADSGALVWKRSFTDAARQIAAVTPDSVSGCTVITPTIGVSSTPVIDRATKMLYVVDKVQIGPSTALTYENRIHQMRLSDGLDAQPPTVISASVTREDGTVEPFVAQNQQNRPGLALASGAIYVAFGSSCDRAPGSVSGWLFAFNLKSLKEQAVFDTTATSANGYLGAIWESTYAPAVDERGNIYVTTGNGTFDANTGHKSYSESVLALDSELHVRDSFTPRRAAILTTYDQDVSAAGVMLIPPGATPGRSLAISGEKDGWMFLLDAKHLGGFNAAHDDVLQSYPIEPTINSLYGGPAFYDGHVYWGATAAPMYDFKLTTAHGPRLDPASRTTNSFPGEGGEIPAVSSDGTRPGSAVVWATTRAKQGQTIQLVAYDALDLSKTLYAGNVGTWYSMGDAFLTPTIADGHVFVPGAGNGVAEFGLR